MAASPISVHKAQHIYEAGDGQPAVWVAVAAIRRPEGGCHALLGRGNTAEDAEADAQAKAEAWWADFAKSKRVPQVTGS